MRASFKKSLFFIIISLVTIFTVSAICGCWSKEEEDDVIYADPLGESNVLIEADSNTVVAGETVTFTITAMTTRPDTNWFSIDLNLTPLKSDLKTKDTSVYPYLSLVGNSFSTSTLFRDTFNVKNEEDRDGVYFCYISNPDAPVNSASTITFEAEVKIDKDIPVDSLTFGFAYGSMANEVRFGGTRGPVDSVKPKSGSSNGTLKFKPVTINIEHHGDSHIKISSDKKSVKAGDTVELTVTAISNRVDTVWHSLYLDLTPLAQDGLKADTSLYPYLSVANYNVGNGNCFVQDSLNLADKNKSTGITLEYSISRNNPLDSSVELEFRIHIKIAESIAADSITFGLESLPFSHATYGKTGDIIDSICNDKEYSRYTYGQLTFNTVTIAIEPASGTKPVEPEKPLDAPIKPTGEKGDTHVAITADKTTVSRGGSVTFTITITPSAERQSLEWLAVNLNLTPLTADLKCDSSNYSYLSGTDVKINNAGYRDLSIAKFVRGGSGYLIGYAYDATSEMPACLANAPLVKQITIKFAEDLPNNVTTMTWGFANTPVEKVNYCKNGGMDDGAEDRIKSSTKYGQLTYEVVTLTIAG